MSRVKSWGSRKDANHREIEDALRAAGAKVKDVTKVPKFVDLVVKYRGRIFLLEIKDGSLPPSARQLTIGEDEFWRYWGEPPVIVTSPDEALEAIGAPSAMNASE